jgi:hypothetical protein
MSTRSTVSAAILAGAVATALASIAAAAPLTEAQVKTATVEEQNEDTIVAEILTVDDSLVQRLAIDRATGTFRRID